MRHVDTFLATAALAAAFLLTGGNAVAGEVTGQVSERATGRSLASATVRIPELNRTATADRSGFYRITDVPEGSYTLEVEYVGFDSTSVQVNVPATGTVEQTFALAASAATAEILVVGYRLQQAQSLQDKKSSSVIKDSVSADEAGKLPDQNAAEALARLPGVSVTTDQGEGRYVTVRGIDASLNNVTLDGAILGSPEDIRRIALDTVPSNLLAKMEVIKSVTPDLDGNSVGATINLITPSAFDAPDGRFFSGSLDYGYYELNGENPYGAAVAWGSTFGDDKWGIVLSASYLEREYQSENLQGGDPWEEEGDFLVPDEFVLRDYEIERIRTGFVANLEFRPTDNAHFYFRNLYNEFKDTEYQPEVIFDYRNGDLLDQTPTSGTFTEGEAQRAASRRVEKQSILSSTLGAIFYLDQWTVEPAITVGSAEQDTPSDREWIFEHDGEVAMSYDTSSRFFRVTAPDSVYDDTQFEFDEAARGRQIIDEDLLIGQIDVQRDFLWNDREGFFKFGGKYVSREKTSDQNMIVYDGLDELDLLLSDVSKPGRSDFYSEEGGYRFGPKVDIGAVESFFRDNEEFFEIDDLNTTIESYGVDYRIDEDVTAGYLMGSIEVGRATIIGGLRVEHTKVDFDAYSLEFLDDELIDGDEEGVPPQVADSKSYTNWLPGLQMRYEARDNLLVRAAWTNTLGRPSYEWYAPYRVFEIEDDDGDLEGSLVMGNPDLDPMESMNWDLSVEWYTDAGGIFAAGVFYKDIDKPIFVRITEIEDGEFEGREYAELEIEQAQNAKSGEIFGIELNLQQQFRNLPSPFDGLGVALSYTYTDSEATIFDRGKVPFFLQSDHVANAAVFYEKRGLELRLAYAYRSEYLLEAADSAQNDLYVDTHGQLDFKASYQFNPNFSGYIQFQNITDEPLRLYSGDKSRMAENERYSWNTLAGVQVKF